MTVIDALTDQPVAGAPVTADLSTSPTQTRSTGADGKVVFAGLEPSAISATDPKYKYRLTVGLTDPWVTHPDSVPALAQQHLTASQTWTTTLKVFKRATIQVNLRDAATGPADHRALRGRRHARPGPDVLSDSLGRLHRRVHLHHPRSASRSSRAPPNFTVAAQADCYRIGLDRSGRCRPATRATPPRSSTSR